MLVLLTVLATPASAAPLNLWGAAAAPEEVAITPLVVASGSDMASSVVLATGLGEHADIAGGLGLVSGFDGVSAMSGLDVMARAFPVGDVAIALHTTWTPGDEVVVVGPEVHASHTWDRFGDTANAGWRANVGAAGSTLTAGLAPEVWVHPRVSAYVELDPSYAIGEGFAMVAVPGVGASIDAEGAHTLSAGVQVPVYPEVDGVSVGVWYTAILGSTPWIGRASKAEGPALASK